MADELKIVLRAINQASGPIDDVRGSLGKLENGASALMTRGLTPLRNMMATGLKAAAVGAGAALAGLVAGLGSSVMAAADMQQGVADISAAMGASAEETGKLKALIGDLGMDPKLKVTAQEAAEAIGTLGTAGLSVDEILSGAARSTVLLANATGAQFGDAAAIASDVMSLFKIKASDMAKAVDGITATTIASKFSINDYRLALAQAGGVASVVGVEVDDFNTVIAAIAPFFASGSDAGTSFKTMLQRLIPQSKDAKELMIQLGLMTADGANAFFDASGKMKSMGEIAGLLNKALGGLSEEQMNNALATLFGTDAMRAAAAMAGMTEQQFNDLKGTMAKTDAEESAAKRMDTFKGALEILAGVVDTLKMQIGEKFLPMLRSMAERLTQFLGDNGPMLVEWAGALADKLSSLVETLLPVFVAKLGQWFAIGRQVVTNVGEMALRVGGFLETVREFVRPLTDFIAQQITLKDVLLGVGAAMTAAVLPAAGAFLATLGAVSIVVGGAIAVVATLRRAWEEDWGNIRGAVGSVMEYLRSRFHMLFDVIRVFGPGALLEIWNWVRGNETAFTNVRQIWEHVKWVGQRLFEDLSGYVTAQLPVWTAKLQEWGAAAWTWMANAAPVALNKLVEWGSALLAWLSNNLPAWVATLGQWGAAAWAWIADATPVALGKLGEWSSGLMAWVVGKLPGWVATLGKWARAAWEWIVGATTDALGKLGEWSSGLMAWVGNKLPEWVATLGKWARAAWEWIVSATTDALGKLGEWGRRIVAWVAGKLPEWVATLGQWGAAAWAWIVNAIPVAVGTLGEWLGTILQWLGDNLPRLIANFLEWSATLWTWVGEAIPKAIAGFGDWLSAILTWNEESGQPGLFQMVAEWVRVLVEWIWNDLIPVVGPALLDVGAAMLTALGKITVELAAAALKLGVSLIVAIAEGLADLVGIDLNLDQVKSTILATISSWTAAIYGAGADVSRRIGDGIRALISNPQGAISSVIENARSVASNLMDAWGSLLGTQGRTAVQSLQAGMDAVATTVQRGIATTLKDIQDYGLAQGLGMLAGRMYELARGGVVDFAKGFVDQSPTAKEDIQTVLNSVNSMIQNLLNGINTFIANWAGPAAGRFFESAKALIGNFLSGWKSLTFDLAAWGEAVVKTLNDWLSGASTAFLSAGGAIISSFLNGWKSQVFDLSSWLYEGINNTLSRWLTSNVQYLIDQGKTIGRSIVEGIGAGITGASETLKGALTYLANLLPQWVKDVLGIHSPSVVFETIGANIMAGLTKGIEEMTLQPRLAIEEAARGLAPAVEPAARMAGTVNNTYSTVAQNYFTIVERGGGSMELAERVRLLNAMYTGL